MKLVELKCKNCKSVLKVKPGTNDIHCKYCNADYKLDDEVQHIKYDDMEKAGYDYEKGRIKARQEHEQEKQQQKIQAQQAAIKAQMGAKNKKWIILAWIFFFPIMLTVWIWTKSKLNNKQRIILTVVAWLFFIIIWAVSGNTKPNDTATTNNSETSAEQIVSDEVVNTFMESYNKIPSSPFTEVKNGNIRTKFFASSHGYYCQLLNISDESGKKVEITINETNDNADLGIAGMKNIFHDIIKTFNPNAEDTLIDNYFNQKISGDSNIVLGENIKTYFQPDQEASYSYSRGRIEITGIVSSDITKTVSDSAERDYMDAMRKCTVTEAADLYSYDDNKNNIFERARKTCEGYYENWPEEDFFEAVYADWDTHKNDTIDGKTLEHYLNTLGW